PVVCCDDETARLMLQRLFGVREAIREVLAQAARGQVETGWSDAGPIPGDPDWAGGTVFTDRRQTEVAASAPDTFAAVARLGGDTGWYGADWLWRLRGSLDHLAGGPGLRRGRRDAERVAYGDAIDFWRVTGVEPGRRLALRAEMRLPGQALLEFTIEPLPAGRTACAWSRPPGSCRAGCSGSPTGTPCCHCTTWCSAACSEESRAPPRLEPCDRPRISHPDHDRGSTGHVNGPGHPGPQLLGT